MVKKINKAVKMYQDVATLVATEIKEYSVEKIYEKIYPTLRQLERNPALAYELAKDNNDIIVYRRKDGVLTQIQLMNISFKNEKYNWILEDYPSLSFSRTEFLAENYFDWSQIKEIAQYVLQHPIDYFSDFADMAKFVKENWELKRAPLVWELNVPNWLHKPVDQLLCSTARSSVHRFTASSSVHRFIDELAMAYNNDDIDKQTIINCCYLAATETLYKVTKFIHKLVEVDVNLALFSTLLPFYMVYSRKNKTTTPKLKKLNERPHWCDSHIWELFNSSQVHKGAEILHQIKDELVKQYSPSKYFYVCMARDAVPLYNLLFEFGYDSMLGVFSRTQIGDEPSVDLLKNEISLASTKTGKKPVLVDVQGRGTIYDYLQQEGINHAMIFGVSSNPDNCRYPLLITDEHIGNKAIRYIEKIPQNNGRAEGVYQRTRCNNAIEDTLIVWGTRDPNAIGSDEELKDWEILQFRGLFMETMGISHVHAGMIGNDHQQRMWGIIKNYKNLNLGNIQVGINIQDSLVKIIKSTRFKTQHEVNRSGGALNPEFRLEDETSQFGNTGIRTTFGILTEDAEYGSQYGGSHCRIDIEKVLPYLYLTDRDSLGEYVSHYPGTELTNYFPEPEIEGTYRECQYNTLLTWEVVTEVIPC